MKPAELLKWFDELEKTIPPANEIIMEFTLSRSAVAWLTSAGSAIEAVFPTGHRVRTDWERALGDPKVRAGLHAMFLAQFERTVWTSRCGVFVSAHEQVKAGRVEGLVDTIRADAEDEVLEQAQALLEPGVGLVAAAAVLVGGALEVHLRRLCEKNKLAWTGHGSIDKYNTAISVARNAGGLAVYEKPEGSLVTSWGQLRNEAAHDPAKFSEMRSAGEVRSMLTSVRDFIARIH